MLLAVEWDDDAAETYRRNHPSTQLYHGDIAKITVDEVLARTGLRPGELDIFDGSPPCQGFSMVGKRDFADDRNQLFREYVRLLTGLKPRVFVMENVAGMVRGKMRLIFAEVLSELKGCGYRVSARLMNTKYFGVPQSRQRLIFIGVREELGIEPTHPRPQQHPISFGEACEDLRGNGPDDRMLGDMLRRVGRLQPDRSECDKKIYKHIMGSLASSISTKWIGWHRVCNTLLKSEISSSGFVHPDRERYISLAEARRVASFPDDYWFSGRAKGIERMGNCVPPRFMAAVAAWIYEKILKPAKMEKHVLQSSPQYGNIHTS